MYGSLFFGAITKLDPLIDAVESAADGVQVRLDARDLQLLDTTGLDALESLAQTIERRGGTLVIEQLHAQPLSLMQRSGFLERVHGWSACADPSTAGPA